jgi:hypothetical protein
LCQSVSISGPSATMKPIEAKICLDALERAVTGCRPPGPRRRPGSVTSSASARKLQLQRGFAQRIAAGFERRLDRCLAD